MEISPPFPWVRRETSISPKTQPEFSSSFDLAKAPAESAMSSSFAMEWHSPCVLNNTWSATTGACQASRFPTYLHFLFLNLCSYFAVNVTAFSSTFWSLSDKKRKEKKIISKTFLSKFACQSQFSLKKLSGTALEKL